MIGRYPIGSYPIAVGAVVVQSDAAVIGVVVSASASMISGSALAGSSASVSGVLISSSSSVLAGAASGPVSALVPGSVLSVSIQLIAGSAQLQIASYGLVVGPGLSASWRRRQSVVMREAVKPSASGLQAVGNTLVVSPGSAQAKASATYYQWYANREPVAGATSPSLLIDSVLASKRLDCAMVFVIDGAPVPYTLKVSQ